MRNIQLTKKATDKIIEKLQDCGFNITEPCTNGEYGVNMIDNDYFNEKVNEALNEVENEI
jgi:hypothetical protein